MGSAELSHCLNLKPDLMFSLCIGLNLGPDFGQVHKSSLLNFGSGANHGITTLNISMTRTPEASGLGALICGVDTRQGLQGVLPGEDEIG
jgi:hypothetical protein